MHKPYNGSPHLNLPKLKGTGCTQNMPNCTKSYHESIYIADILFIALVFVYSYFSYLGLLGYPCQYVEWIIGRKTVWCWRLQ